MADQAERLSRGDLAIAQDEGLSPADAGAAAAARTNVAGVDASRLLPPAGAATLVLVRHGESTYVAEGRFQGRHDAPLSVLGERQASLVAARLASRDDGVPLPIPAGPPLGVWHSPLARAAATAARIAESQPAGVATYPTPQLTEIAQGEWEGVLAADVRARWPAELAAWRRRPTQNHAPGGEPVLSAAARVRAGLASIIDTLLPPAALGDGADAGGSADAAAARASLRDEPVPGYPTVLKPGDVPLEPWAVVVAHDGIFRLAAMTLLDVPYERFWSFPFNLCAISVIALSDGVATLRAHNLTEHLAPLAEEERAAAEARGDRRGAL